MNARFASVVTISLLAACVGCSNSSSSGASASDSVETRTESSGIGDKGDSERALVDAGAAGGRVGVHGMVLFGKEKLYLSHIPMFHAPHDVQMILEVKFTSGPPAGAQFNGELYTFEPRSLSLTDLASGALSSLRGKVYKGDFEGSGTAQYDAEIHVERVVFAQLLVARSAHAANLNYLAVGTPSDVHLVHVIDDTPSFDHIVEATTSGTSHLAASDLEQGLRGVLVGTTNAVASRPKSPNTVTFRATDSSLGDGGSSDTALTVGREADCSLGPDFFDSCR